MSRSAGLSVQEIRTFYETESADVQAQAKGVREFFETASPAVRKVVLGMIREDLAKQVPARSTAAVAKKRAARPNGPVVPAAASSTESLGAEPGA